MGGLTVEQCMEVVILRRARSELHQDYNMLRGVKTPYNKPGEEA